MKVDIREFSFIHISLRAILGWLEDETRVIFTGNLDPNETPPMKSIYIILPNKVIGESIENLINDTFIYGESGQCAVYNNGYLHIQVSDDTRMRD